MTRPDPQTLASKLCLACAMCCDGSIYKVAIAKDDETDRAASHGFRLTIASDGRQAFELPCHYLEGTACARYQEWRPSTCGKFRCSTQIQALEGTISEDQALARIASALAVRAQILPMLEPGQTMCDARVRFDVLAKQHTTLSREDAAFTVRMFAFERMLDAHFREEGQARLPSGTDRPSS